MKLATLIDNLTTDLSREYAHMNFYLSAATNVEGLRREELSEFFKGAAEGEMGHVLEFRKLLKGFDVVPKFLVAPFGDSLTDPRDLLNEALKLELEVVENYAKRMTECDELCENGGGDDIDGKFVHAFIEQQLLDSRQDADEIKEMLR